MKSNAQGKPDRLRGHPNVRLCSARPQKDFLFDSKGGRVVFHEKLVVELHFNAEQACRCFVPALNVAGEGANQRRAQAAAADAIRAETDTLLHTMSHTLSREQLERKGILLGNVDVVSSGISKPLGEYAWVAGRVERDANRTPVFRDGRTNGETYRIDPTLPIPNDSFLRMAKMRRDPAGDPMGPVLELDEPLDNDPEATWAEWRRIMSRGD
jgi:hypothetical protein